VHGFWDLQGVADIVTYLFRVPGFFIPLLDRVYGVWIFEA